MTAAHNYSSDESLPPLSGYPEQQRAIIFSRDGRKCMNITIAKPPTPPSLNIEPVDIFLDSCPPPVPSSTSTKKKKKKTKSKKKGENLGQTEPSCTSQSKSDDGLKILPDSMSIPNCEETSIQSISFSTTNCSLQPDEGNLKKKKKKGEELPDPLLQIQSHALNNFPDTSNDAIWSSDNSEERQRIREFWLHLGEEERRALVKVEKEAVLRRMKEERDPCPCTRCGQKRQALEDELEVLYDAYYDELEQYANHQQQYLACENQSECSEEEYEVEFEEEEVVEYEDSDDEEEEEEHNSAYFDLGDSLKIKGGILTVADDLIKNDGKRFLAMMERLANRSVRKEEDSSAIDSRARVHHDIDSRSPSIDVEIKSDGDRGPDGAGKEDQSIDENRRMFQVFAARMFEQRVLTAYREKIAQDRQQKLLQELEEENRLQREKEQRKLKKQEKKKEKRRQLKEQKEQERLKKEEEQRLKEEAIKIQREAQRKKKEEERLKKEEQRKHEELLRQETERKAKALEEKARKEKEAKELEEKNRREEEERNEMIKSQAQKAKLSLEAPVQAPTTPSSPQPSVISDNRRFVSETVSEPFSTSQLNLDSIILNGGSPVRPYYQMSQVPYNSTGFFPTTPSNGSSPIYKQNRASTESESVTRKLSELTLQSCLSAGVEPGFKSQLDEPESASKASNISDSDQKRASISSATLESIFAPPNSSIGAGASSNSHFPLGVNTTLPFSLSRPTSHPLNDAVICSTTNANSGHSKEVPNGASSNNVPSEFEELPSKIIRPPQSKVIARPSPIQQPRSLPTSSEYSHLSSPSIASFGLPKVWNTETDSPPVSHPSPATSPISQPSSLFSGPLFGSLIDKQSSAPNQPQSFDSTPLPSSSLPMPGYSPMGHGWSTSPNAPGNSELFRKEVGLDWGSRQALWFSHSLVPQAYSDSSLGYIQDPMVLLWDQIRQSYYHLESALGTHKPHPPNPSNLYSLTELKHTHLELFGESTIDEAKIFEACQVGNRWSQSAGQGLFIFKQDPSQPNIILARFEEPIATPLRQPPVLNPSSLPRNVIPIAHPLNTHAGLYSNAYLDSVVPHNFPSSSSNASIFGHLSSTSSRKVNGSSNVDIGVNGVLS
ncbi:Stress response protein nst1 [Basidiobolus ranarum]|uniref:Stress response protein NST1 n=1 Tax=Basidiobolus ranarum TaxID=34480 RepID=A0ABR2X353_9FUNG